jgi:hypothetical protein
MQQAGSRRPSAALVVATIALVVAASGSAFAAGQMVTGDNLIRKDSLSGNRLRFRTLTGTQINLKKLGTVPTAVEAQVARSATTAQTATTADTAQDATKLGGLPASSYVTGSGAVGTKGIVKVAGTATGHTVPLFTSGPFTISITCTSSSDGPSLTLLASSTEANADLDGNVPVAANTPTDLGFDVAASTTPFSYDGLTLDFNATSGAYLIIQGGEGVSSLGTDCWADFAGTN